METCSASIIVQDTEPYLYFEPFEEGFYCCELEGHNLDHIFSFYDSWYIVDCNPLHEDFGSYVSDNSVEFLYSNSDTWSCGENFYFGLTVSDACGNLGEYDLSYPTGIFLETCWDDEACNYQEDDYYCKYPGYSSDLCWDSDFIYDSECEVYHVDEFCWESSACNYVYDTGFIVGECLFPGDSCDDNNPNTINDILNENCQCNGQPISYGCLDELACNYSLEANENDGSCCYTNCGCTDVEALNYDPLAECDSGCLYVPGDSDGDGYISVGDLTTFLSNFGNACVPDEFCFGDLDGNGSVTSTDLIIFLNVFGQQF